MGPQCWRASPPLANLGKLDARAARCVYLHKSTRTPGAARVGMLTHDGKLQGTAERRTVRAALTPAGVWSFPDIKAVQLERRCMPAAPGLHPCESDENTGKTQDLDCSTSDRGGASLDSIRRAGGE